MARSKATKKNGPLPVRRFTFPHHSGRGFRDTLHAS
jgi:hypothetical protein